MTSRQARPQEGTYFRVMRILHESPIIAQRELTKRQSISIGGFSYCLTALMEKGLVKINNFATSKNKFGYVYALTPSGINEKAAITHRFLRPKMHEYEELTVEIEALAFEVRKSDGERKQQA